MASSTQYTQEYQKAVTAYIQGNYDQAATIVDKLVTTRPDDPNIRLLRGHIFCCQEQYQPAQEQYELVLNLTSDPELINCANESLSKTLELVGTGGMNGGNAYDSEWNSDEPTGLQMGHTLIQHNQPAPQTESVSSEFQSSESVLEEVSAPTPDESLLEEFELDPFAALETPVSDPNLAWSDIPTDLGDLNLETDIADLNFEQDSGLEDEDLDSENEMTMLMPNQPEISGLDSELVAPVGDAGLDNLDNLFGDPFDTDIGDSDLFATEIPQAWSAENQSTPMSLTLESGEAALDVPLATEADMSFDFDPNALRDLGELGDLEGLGDIADLEEFDSLEDFDLDNISDLSGDLSDFAMPEAVAIDESATEIQLEANSPTPEPLENLFPEEVFPVEATSEPSAPDLIPDFATETPLPMESSLEEAIPTDLGFDFDLSWEDESRSSPEPDSPLGELLADDLVPSDEQSPEEPLPAEAESSLGALFGDDLAAPAEAQSLDEMEWAADSEAEPALGELFADALGTPDDPSLGLDALDFGEGGFADETDLVTEMPLEAEEALFSFESESDLPSLSDGATSVYLEPEPGLELDSALEESLESAPVPDAADLMEFTDTELPLDLAEISNDDDLTAFLEPAGSTPESETSVPAFDLEAIPAALDEEDEEDLFGDFSTQAPSATTWDESEDLDTVFMDLGANTEATTTPPTITTFADPDAQDLDLELLEIPELEAFGAEIEALDLGQVESESSESLFGDTPQLDTDTFQTSEAPLPGELGHEPEIPINETFAIVPDDLDLSAELSQLPDLDFGEANSDIATPISAELEDLSAFTQETPAPGPVLTSVPVAPKSIAAPIASVAPASSDTAVSFGKRNTTTALTVGVVSALASGLVGLGISQGNNVPSALLGGVAGGLAGGVAAYGLGRRNVDHIKRCTTDLQAQFNAVITGDMSATATVFSQDELGQLATSFNTMTQSIQSVMSESQQKAEENERQRDDLQRQVIRLLDDVEGAARGDLTVQAEVTADVLGAVADSFNLTIFNLRKIVQQVKVAARQVNKGATDNETFARSLSSDALRQAEELAVTLNSVQMMTNAIQRVAESAKEANQVARNATEAAMRGGEAVERTVAGILQIRETVAETTRKVKHLAESSQEISKIVGLISQISARTNLLALNASIEAARAGESGKGFAIVADEVRQLADRAAKSSKEIEQIVLQIQSETGAVMTAMEEGTQQVIEGTRRAEQAKHSLEDIIQVSSQIDNLVRSITSATVEQTETARSMAQVMQSVELTAQATSQEAQRVSDSLQNLVTVARDLQSSVERFKVEQTEEQG